MIAVIRASGSISRLKSPSILPGSGIIAEQLIEKNRSVRGTLILLLILSLMPMLLSTVDNKLHDPHITSCE